MRTKSLQLLSLFAIVFMLGSGFVGVNADGRNLSRTWSGLQYPDPDPDAAPTWSFYVESPMLKSIKLQNSKMVVLAGYKFGSISVSYEVIDEMVITFGNGFDLTKPQPFPQPFNIYEFPQSGSFSWYDENGVKIGGGDFSVAGGTSKPYGGSLTFNVADFSGEGEYVVLNWKEEEMMIFGATITVMTPRLIRHIGSYNRAQ